jgi:hypothetical protein
MQRELFMKSFDAVEFHSRSIADAAPEIKGEAQQVYERTQQNDNVLLDTTLTWMARLPKDLRPMVLATRYPRIANNIADIWRRVARCEEYLDTLVVDRRGNRAGFPPDVARELNNLRGLYTELHPDNRSCWDHAGAAD